MDYQILLRCLIILVAINHKINVNAQTSSKWVIEVPGGYTEAEKVAEELGFKIYHRFKFLKNKYEIVQNEKHPRYRRDLTHQRVTRTLTDHPSITWAEHQKERLRAKRDFLNANHKRNNEIWNDQYWPQQWYLHNSHIDQKTQIKTDLNVIQVWKKNITGRGVVVSVIDDGIEKDHPDLINNYDAKASADIIDNDDDPTSSDSHGTRCSGEIAMSANNHICGVGIAYNANIGGIRILGLSVTDSVEARALSHGLGYIDIYSNSWGPADNGRTMEGPGVLAQEALIQGITHGRNGLGSIFVWASGNGGFYKDSCQCDGYASSIYTVSISSVDRKQKSPWYSEHCASTMASTYSSGMHDYNVVTTDLYANCTTHHSGTSASAPMAAGIFALVLEKKPSLNWRDIQHLVAWTSDYEPLSNNPGWHENGAGFRVNNRFGFGLLNAEAIVDAADDWHNVPAKIICDENHRSKNKIFLQSGMQINIEFDVDGCRGSEAEINYLEHIEVLLNMSYSNRGSIEIILSSPAGMQTELLQKRNRDHSSKGIKDWSFMSVHNWGENPRGLWQVKIFDQSNSNSQGFIYSVKLILHGTKHMPNHLRKTDGRRVYKKKIVHSQQLFNSTEIKVDSQRFRTIRVKTTRRKQ